MFQESRSRNKSQFLRRNSRRLESLSRYAETRKFLQNKSGSGRTRDFWRALPFDRLTSANDVGNDKVEGHRFYRVRVLRPDSNRRQISRGNHWGACECVRAGILYALVSFCLWDFGFSRYGTEGLGVSPLMFFKPLMRFGKWLSERYWWRCWGWC